MTNQNALIIFVRNAELGKVKTRLAKEIGDEKALEIYRYLLYYTAVVARKADCTRYVFYSEKIEEKDEFDSTFFTKMVQQGNDLGERMRNAFAQVFALGHQHISIIGSDCYDLESSHIDLAFEQLEKTEVVIGPSKDGGYYLLGMNKLFTTLFNKKAWGTDTVLVETMEEINRLGVSFSELPVLNDIDTFEDLVKTDLAAKCNFKL